MGIPEPLKPPIGQKAPVDPVKELAKAAVQLAKLQTLKAQ
jgi:hypothetical protein